MRGEDSEAEVLPEWLKLLEHVHGAEDDDADEDAEAESEEDEDAEEDEDDEDAEEDEDEGEGKPESKTKKAAKKSTAQQEKERADGLEEALRKERLARRKAEREARAAKKAAPAKKAPAKKAAPKNRTAEEDETSSEDQEHLRALEERSKKLAEGLLTQAVDRVIIRLASKFKFKDVDDALTGIKRKDIETDQDDEDPTDIEINEKSVERALKRLAKTKPYLLDADEDDEEDEEGEEGKREDSQRKTTPKSKFNGKKSKDQLSEEQLKARYPALRGGRA